MKRIEKHELVYSAKCKKCRVSINQENAYFDLADMRYWHIDCLPKVLLKETLEPTSLDLIEVITRLPVKCANTYCDNKTIETGMKATFNKSANRYYHAGCVNVETRKRGRKKQANANPN